MQLNTICLQLRYLANQCHGKEVHQTGYLVSRAIPVFRRKGEDCQHTDTSLPTGFHAATKRVNAFFMAGNPWKKPL